MFINTRPVPRVPGLKGSDLARAENLNNAGPFKPIGHQPLFAGGSPDGNGGTGTGGYKGGCGSGEETGQSSGGNNTTDNSMIPPSLNPCYGGSPPYRPPICNACDCGSPPPSGGGGGAGLGPASPCVGGGR